MFIVLCICFTFVVKHNVVNLCHYPHPYRHKVARSAHCEIREVRLANNSLQLTRKCSLLNAELSYEERLTRAVDCSTAVWMNTYCVSIVRWNSSTTALSTALSHCSALVWKLHNAGITWPGTRALDQLLLELDFFCCCMSGLRTLFRLIRLSFARVVYGMMYIPR